MVAPAIGPEGSRPRVNVDVALSLPHEAGTVGLIRKVVTNALGTVGVSDSCVYDIGLALSEACTNVVDHAADDDEYEVRLEVDGERCAISVKNTGTGFDADALSGVTPDAASPRGRGVAIMRAVMDSVDFASEPETGTIVHLVKSVKFRDDGPLEATI
jgi:serine/threonine-protein kinase RsbW